jgi:cardiolipin synthase A/B
MERRRSSRSDWNQVEREIRRQIGIFQEDLAHSRQVTFQEWKDRPLAEKFWEHAATLFGPQL